MANLNKVFLMGNLTRDPELRYTPNGTAVVDFGMAINRTWTSRQGGEKREETCFVDVQAWARSAEVISEYCSKGRPIFIEGRLKLDTWEGRDGQRRSKHRVIVENFQFLGPRTGKRAATNAEPRPASPSSEASPAQPPAGDAPAENAPEDQFHVDDDIPF